MLGELFATPRTRCDSNRARAEDFAAGDIVTRVADHIDARDIKLMTVLLRRAFARERTELIAIVMIVGERAEFEVILEPVALQFELRAAFQISGEQCEHAIRIWLHPIENLLHSGQDVAVELRQDFVEPAQVHLEKFAHIFLRRFDAVFAQNTPRDVPIGAAGDLDVAQIIFHAEAFLHRTAQRFIASTAARDQRSIDVPK